MGRIKNIISEIILRVSNVTSVKKKKLYNLLCHENLMQLIVIAGIGIYPLVYILCHSDFRVSTSVLRPRIRGTDKLSTV